MIQFVQRRLTRRAADPQFAPAYRFWRPGDTPAINAFYNDALIRGVGPAGERSHEQWHWEFASAHGDSPPYVVAECGDQIVGTEAYIPIELLRDGQLIRSGKDEDTLVHPDFRGRGVLDEMYRLLFERARNDSIDLLWGFTAVAQRPLLRNGFENVCPFTSMQLDLSTKSGTRLRTNHQHIHLGSLIEPEVSCDRFSTLFAEQHGGITLHLSSAYLRWRVFENPFRAYTVMGAKVEADLVGMAIIKCEPNHKRLFFSDLVAVSHPRTSAPETLQLLLDSGLDFARRRGYRFVEARPAGAHPYNLMLCDLLSQNGFVAGNSNNAPSFLVRRIASQADNIHDAAVWRLCELMREY